MTDSELADLKAKAAAFDSLAAGDFIILWHRGDGEHAVVSSITGCEYMIPIVRLDEALLDLEAGRNPLGLEPM
jgi:hypothetical protein